MQRTGIYLDAPLILRNPGYLETLRDKLGLSLVIISYSGTLSPEVARLSPFDGAPPSDDCLRGLLATHIDGQPSTTKLDKAKGSLGPHVGAGGDDATLREAIGRAHAVGLEVWLLGGGWTASDYDVLMFCPAHEGVNRWLEAVYVDMATGYGVEGVDVTHARFPMASYPRGLFLGAGARGARAAAELGYDLDAMVADIQATVQHWRTMDPAPLIKLLELETLGLGLGDLWQLLGVRPGLFDWFRYRTQLLGRNLARFRAAVHAAAGDGFVFLSDTYPASLSLYMGHDHTRWGEFSDCASPLISHLDIFVTQVLVEWARFFQGLVPALSEALALRLAQHLTGYQGLSLPEDVAAYALGDPDGEFRNVPAREVLRLDMAKARAYLPPGLPSYPIIQGGGAPHPWPRDMIAQMIADADALGHQGVIFQGTQSLVDYELRR
ncbi:MAG: hypothetical protein V1772_05465 [Chloroflexota bacterium]